MRTRWKPSFFLILRGCNALYLSDQKTGRCGVSPLEGVMENAALAVVAIRGRLSPSRNSTGYKIDKSLSWNYISKKTILELTYI
jgi:hypothetical protein